MDPAEPSKDARPPKPRWAWVLLVLALGLWALAPRGASWLGISRWISIALVIASWPQLSEQVFAPLRRAYAETRLQPPWPNLALVVLFLALLFPLWAGEPPVSRDHGVHYFQTARFVDAWHHAFSSDAGLAAWSDELNAGYPFGDSYPLLGYALTSALHLLSGGLIALRTSYALGIVAVWALVTWAVRALAIRAMREIRPKGAEASQEAGRNDMYAWAGTMAAACFLFDPGESRQGGWIYCMFHGVWPQLLATGAWLASLELSLRAFRGPTPRRIALAALGLGAALTAHPFAWPCAAMSSLALFSSCLWSRREQKGQLIIWAAIHLGALALAAGTLCRFFISSGALVRGPVIWDRLALLLRELIAGEGFAPTVVAIAACALVGAFLLIRAALRPEHGNTGSAKDDAGAGPRWSTLWCALISMILVCASLEALTVLRLDLLVPELKNLQFPRFAIVFRPLWAIAGGVGLCWLVDAIREKVASSAANSEPQLASPLPARIALGLLAAPLIVGALEMLGGGVRAPVGHPQVMWKHVDLEIEQELQAQLVHEIELAKNEKRGRVGVAFLRRGMSPTTYPMFSITDAGARLVMDEHIPAVNFRHHLEGRALSSLHAVGATHVLYDRPLKDKIDATLLGALEPIWTRGPWTLARIANAKGRAQPWSKVESERKIEVELSATPGGYAIEVKGAHGAFDLVTAIAPYFRWQLKDSRGEIFELGQARPSPGLAGMRMRLPGDGRYTLLRQELRHEKWTRSVSWLALLISMLALGSSHELKLNRPASPPSWAPHMGVIMALSFSLLASLSFLRQEQLLQTTWREAWADTFTKKSPPPDEIPRFKELNESEHFDISAPQRPHCSALGRRDPKEGCSRAQVQSYTSVLYRHPYLHRCASFHIDAHERRTLKLRTAPGQELLVIGSLGRPPKGVRVTLAPDEKSDARKGLKARVVVEPRVTPLDLRAINPRVLRTHADDAGIVELHIHNANADPRRLCIAAAEVLDTTR